MKFEVAYDVPGVVPGPSLGGGPREIGPATRRLGVSRPAGRTVSAVQKLAFPTIGGRGRCAEAAGRQSRDARVLPDTRHPRASCPGHTKIGGDRVHRGEPLLLGVEKEYQASYRHFARAP